MVLARCGGLSCQDIPGGGTTKSQVTPLKSKTVSEAVVFRIFLEITKLSKTLALSNLFEPKEVLQFKVFHNTILPILHGTAPWAGEDAILAHLRRLFRRTRRYHDIQGATGSCKRVWYWKAVHIVEKRGYFAGDTHFLPLALGASGMIMALEKGSTLTSTHFLNMVRNDQLAALKLRETPLRLNHSYESCFVGNFVSSNIE